MPNQTHLAYLLRGTRPRRAPTRVALAWAIGRPEWSGPNVRTDGHTVWSYDHPIAHTTPEGAKVAHDCRVTPTTSHHSQPVRAVADAIEPCPTCALAFAEEHP